MKPHLDRVTLVAFDATCPELTDLAIRDSLDQVSFAETIVCAPHPLADDRVDRFVRTPAWPNIDALCNFLWYEAPDLVKTDFVLLVHYDSFVIDGSRWEDEFLNYDWVGAPWWYNDGHNVGNGFLRSVKLMRYLKQHRDKYPMVHPEDDTLCRKYRTPLEKAGFRWPSEQVAARFAFECTRPSPDSKHFMFHDMFNFPAVLSPERLEQRLRVARATPYLQKHPLKLKELDDMRRAEILPRLASEKSTAPAEYGFDAAIMMMRAGQREQAAEVLWNVVRVNHHHADAWALLARTEADAGRFRNAMLYHAHALQVAPERYDLWCNRGVDAMSARMYDESAESYERSLKIKDTHEAHYNYGNLLCATMQVDAAVAHYQAALALESVGNPQIYPNLAIAMMAQGKWKEGFTAYRGRFNAPGFPPRARFNYPMWNGEDLYGKTIMLYAEQGFGDEIMSLRFVDPVKKLGARVVLAVRPPMYRLVRDLPGIDVILMYDPPPTQVDYMCPLLDVPAHVDITPATVPLARGYLAPEDRGFELAFPPGLDVGICWASGKRDLQPGLAETARQKSVSFPELAGALARPGVNLYSLQLTHNDDLRAFNVRDVMAGATDFADTAWIMAQLDMVVTVDTSVAHLAGALGVPVWNLVRHDALWPWGTEGLNGSNKSCWYDSMTVYRQERPFDWGSVLRRLKADFAAHLESGALPRQDAAA